MKHKHIILPAIALLAAFLLGRCSGGRHPALSPSHSDGHTAGMAEIWTCSMHPQIQLPKPGKCPICFMDLIPVSTGSDGDGEREIVVSAYSAKLMELETAEAVRRFAQAQIRMVGKVDYDETRVAVISSWVPGRIDRLFVDYTGIAVKKGDHLAELYSPDLITAQEELLQAVRTLEKMKQNPSRLMLESAEKTLDAIREKLRLWGFTAGQIAEIEQRGTPGDQMTLYSPVGGIVIHKNA